MNELDPCLRREDGVGGFANRVELGVVGKEVKKQQAIGVVEGCFPGRWWALVGMFCGCDRLQRLSGQMEAIA